MLEFEIWPPLVKKIPKLTGLVIKGSARKVTITLGTVDESAIVVLRQVSEEWSKFLKLEEIYLKCWDIQSSCVFISNAGEQFGE